MPTVINSIQIFPELSTNGTDWLLGGITNKMTAVLDVSAEWIARAAPSDDGGEMQFSALSNSIRWFNNNWINTGFYVGDDIQISSAGGNNGVGKIVSITGDTIVVSGITFVDLTTSTAVVEGITECTGISLRANLIENSEPVDYNSLIDQNEVRFKQGDIDYTDPAIVPLVQQGIYKSNHIGGATITRASIVAQATVAMEFDFNGGAADEVIWVGGNFEQLGFNIGATVEITNTSSNNGTFTITSLSGDTMGFAENISNETSTTGTITKPSILNRFIVTHEFYITPFFLLAQLIDLQNDVAPDYFFDSSCLKYIYNATLHYDITDPNRVHTSDPVFLNGNTGWFNENFNQGIPKFTLDNIDFTVNGDSETYADPTVVTDVELTITSEDGVFSDNNTQFVLNHFILPEDQSEYINTSTDVETNFMFDRALQTVGSAFVNGDQFGTDKQVFTNITATFVDANTITINAKIDLSSDYKDRIALLNAKQFILCVSIQDHTKETEVSDLVVVRNGIQNYFTDVSNPDLATIETEIIPFADSGDCDLCMFPEDALKGCSTIFFDNSNGGLMDELSIVLLACKGGEEFELERKNFSFAGAVIQDGFQQINIQESRGFILGDTNPFNEVSLTTLGGGDNYNNDYNDDYGALPGYYKAVYSFKIRWEDFIALAGVNSAFYDIGQKNDGFNNQWLRYDTLFGWSVKYRVELKATENGFQNTIIDEKNIDIVDYESSANWTQDIKAIDIDSMIEIGGNVLSDKLVRIEAEFEKVNGTNPTLAEVNGILEIEPFEEGGIGVIRNINNIYPHEDGSPFVSTLNNKLLEIVDTGSTFKLIANLDASNLTGKPKISARIYDPTCSPSAVILYGMAAEQYELDGNRTGFSYGYDVGADAFTDVDTGVAFGKDPGGMLPDPLDAPIGYTVDPDNPDTLYGLVNIASAVESDPDPQGVIFRKTINGAITIVHEFEDATGRNPVSPMVKASDGNFYGTTPNGGANFFGVIYKFDPNTDTYTKLHDFASGDGTNPFGGLIEAVNNELYGITFTGGANVAGTLYKYNINTLTFTKLYDFQPLVELDGVGRLLLASDGKLYGISNSDATSGGGSLFSYDIGGATFANEHQFAGFSSPFAGVIQATNGLLYGTTAQGGTNTDGEIYSFDINTSTFTSVHSFTYGIDGANPRCELLEASNGLLYGVTREGGQNDKGTLFSFDTSTKTLVKLQDFDFNYDGSSGGIQFAGLIEKL